MQAHLLQLQRKQVTVKYFFFSSFGDFPTQEIKKKKKRNLLGSNIFGFRRHSQQSGRLYHISAYSNDINIYEQKYMKTILIQKKDYARWKLTILQKPKILNNLNEYGNTFILLRNMKV